MLAAPVKSYVSTRERAERMALFSDQGPFGTSVRVSRLERAGIRHCRQIGAAAADAREERGGGISLYIHICIERERTLTVVPGTIVVVVVFLSSLSLLCLFSAYSFSFPCLSRLATPLRPWNEIRVYSNRPTAV